MHARLTEFDLASCTTRMRPAPKNPVEGYPPVPQVTMDCHFFVEHRHENSWSLGIRTPDLLHAIQARNIAGRGRASPTEPLTCDNPGSMWPDVARRLPTLAPGLAPRKLVSSAKVRRIEQAAGAPPPPAPAADDLPR